MNTDEIYDGESIDGKGKVELQVLSLPFPADGMNVSSKSNREDNLQSSFPVS